MTAGVGLALLFGGAAFGDTVTIPPAKDAALAGGSFSTTNYGGSGSGSLHQNLGLGFTKNLTGGSVLVPLRGLLQFNLSAIPAGATVQSATLNLWVGIIPSSALSLQISPASASWVESQVTWSSQPAVSSSHQSTASISGSGWKVMDVTPMVQAWVEGQLPNNGMRIVAPSNESGAEKYAAVAQRERLDAFGASLGATIVVTYSLPSAIEVQLYRASDTSGTPSTSNPGAPRTSVAQGETLRVTMRARNTGAASVSANWVANLAPTGTQIVPDNLNSDVTPSNTNDQTITAGGAWHYYSRDFLVTASNPAGAYDFLGAIRSGTDWVVVLDDTAPGADTTSFGSAAWLTSVLEVVTPAPGSFSLTSPQDWGTLTPGATSALLSWGTSSNAASYDVYFGATSPPPFVQNVTTGTSVTRSSLTPGATYFWTVVAKNATGTTATTSGTRRFRIPAQVEIEIDSIKGADGVARTQYAPGETVRVTLKARNTSTTSRGANWVLNLTRPGTHTNVPQYAYNSDPTASNINDLTIPTGGGWVTRAFDWAIPTGATLGFYDLLGAVRDSSNWDWALDDTEVGAGTAGLSEPAWRTSVLEVITPAPGPFSLTSPEDWGTLTPGAASALLSWGTSSNAASYDVYFGTTSPPPFVQNVTTGTSVTRTSLTPGATYFWTVVAKNATGTTATTSGTRRFRIPAQASAEQLVAEMKRAVESALGKSLADSYAEGKKHLIFFAFSAPYLHPVELTLVLDFDDIARVTPEGREGFVTYWMDGEVGLSGDTNPLPLNAGFFAVERHPNVDDPLRRGEVTVFSTGFAGGKWTALTRDASGVQEGSVEWAPDLAFASFSVVSTTWNLVKGEMLAGDLMLALDESLEPIPTGTSNAWDQIGRSLVNQGFEVSTGPDLIKTRLGGGRPFTSSDDPQPGTGVDAITSVRGGIDVTGDGWPDNYLSASAPSGGHPSLYSPLTVWFRNDGTVERNYRVEVVDLPVGWEVEALDAEGNPVGASYPTSAAPNSAVGTQWRIGSVGGSALTVSIRFRLYKNNLLFDELLDTVDAKFSTAAPVTTTCTSFGIDPLQVSPGPDAGSRSVQITGWPSGCQGGSWTASGNGSWLTVQPTAGTGSGSVTVSWTANTLTPPRPGTATVAGNVFSVNQSAPVPPVCTSFGIDPVQVSPGPDAGSRSVQITGSPSGCQGGSWTGTGNGSWLTVQPTAGTGSGSVTVSWTANTLTSPRPGTATVAGNVFSVNQSAPVPPVCTSFGIDPMQVSPGPGAGSRSVQITGSPSGCQGGSWTASGNGSWLAVLPTTGMGSGWVAASWTANPQTFPRSGTATIAGSVFSVNQSGTTPPACTSFGIDPLQVSPVSDAGSRSVQITGSPSGCQGGSWTASGNGSWLTVQPTTGMGSGSVTASWIANTLTTARAGTATIAGNAFSVNQSAAVPPVCTSFGIDPLQVSPGPAAGSRSVQITGSPSGCQGGSWTAAGNGSWPTVQPGEGTGSGSVAASWTANEGTSERSGTASIAGNTLSVSQDESPQISISDVNTVEGNAGITNAVFTVSLSASSALSVTVSAATSNVTATAGSDYTATGPTTLTFAPGTTSRTFTVPIIGETLFEADETFQVTLSSSVNASILDAVGLGTITNDDVAPPARVFVSSSGSDANDCANQITPCRNLAGAVAQVAIDGEVIVLSSGAYETAPLVITKGLKVSSPAGAVVFITQPITINAPGGRVALRGLTLQGTGTGNGITLTAAAGVSIEDTTIGRWANGLQISNALAAQVSIINSVFRANTAGIRDSGGAAGNRISVEDSRFERNTRGIEVLSGAFMIRESAFIGNTAHGVVAGPGFATIHRSEFSQNATAAATLSGGTVRLSRSRVFGNAVGLSASAGSTFESTGTNVVRRNTTNTSGTIILTPEQ